VIAALVVLALATPADSAKLAVLPFKNLNADAALDWLKLGVAETMISDLKAAKRDVVERDQIDKALAELALQKASGTDENTAAQAGKLVGATHVVVGGFQKAGDQLRITARLVVVETGVVDTTAKVTGPVTDVFALQDQVVATLLKTPPPKPRPKPKSPARTLDAYKAYALSLATASDAEKVEQLRRALDLDPDFHYALYDLRALESRLDRYAKKGRLAVDERTQQMLAVVDDATKTPQERNMQAVMAMNGLMSQFRYQALLDVATRIYDLQIPEAPPPMAGMPPMRAKEYAGYYVFLSLMMLKRTDLALQAGERALQQWPGGVFAQSIDLQMRNMIDQAHRHEDNLKKTERELASLELDAQKAPPLQARNFAFRRCSTLASGERWADAVDVCKQFAADYAAADDGDNLVKLSHLLVMRSWAELGRFDEAKAEADRILDAYPDWARQNSINMIAATYPKP
jgi:TolB-like protein